MTVPAIKKPKGSNVYRWGPVRLHPLRSVVGRDKVFTPWWGDTSPSDVYELLECGHWSHWDLTYLKWDPRSKRKCYQCGNCTCELCERGV